VRRYERINDTRNSGASDITSISPGLGTDKFVDSFAQKTESEAISRKSEADATTVSLVPNRLNEGTETIAKLSPSQE
jgi:hypothetical protein